MRQHHAWQVVFALFFITMVSRSFANQMAPVGEIMRSQEILQEENERMGKLQSSRFFMFNKVVVDDASLLSPEQVQRLQDVLSPYVGRFLTGNELDALRIKAYLLLFKEGASSQEMAFNVSEGILHVKMFPKH